MNYCIVSIGYNNTCMLVVKKTKQGIRVLDADTVKSCDCFSFGAMEDPQRLVSRIKLKLMGQFDVKCDGLVVVLGQDMCHSTFIDAHSIEGKPNQKLKKVKEIANGKRHTGFTLTELLKLGENDTREIYQWMECHNRTIDKFISTCFQERLPVISVLSSTYSLHHFNRSVPCNFEVVSDSEENKMVKGATFMIEVGVTSTKYTILHNNLPLESRDSKFNLSSVVNALSNCSKSFFDSLIQFDTVGFIKPNRIEESEILDESEESFSISLNATKPSTLFDIPEDVDLFDGVEELEEELLDSEEDETVPWESIGEEYEQQYTESIDIEPLEEVETSKLSVLLKKFKPEKKPKTKRVIKRKESLKVSRADKYLDELRVDEQDFMAMEKESVDAFSDNDKETYNRYMEVITDELISEINEALTGMSTKYNVPVQKFFVSCPDINGYELLVEDIGLINSSLYLEPGYEIYYENFIVSNDSDVTLTQMYALCIGGAMSLTVKGCDMYEE